VASRGATSLAKVYQAEIIRCSRALLEIVDEATDPVIRDTRSGAVLEPQVAVGSAALSSVSYAELYAEQRELHAYNLRFLDGALVQMSYRFDAFGVVAHRLSYLPDPDLVPFDEDSDMYIQGLPFAEIVGPQRVIVPLRFDYDTKASANTPLKHPVSHLTLGQHTNCRIPASSLVPPTEFLQFVTSAFYHGNQYWVPSARARSERPKLSLFDEESAFLHLAFGCRHD